MGVREAGIYVIKYFTTFFCFKIFFPIFLYNLGASYGMKNKIFPFENEKIEASVKSPSHRANKL